MAKKVGKYKIKSKSSAKKRFSLTATGLVKLTQANKQHNMRKRSGRQLRNNRGCVASNNEAAVIVAKKYNLHVSNA